VLWHPETMLYTGIEVYREEPPRNFTEREDSDR
jgi:hypothetical protein